MALGQNQRVNEMKMTNTFKTEDGYVLNRVPSLLLEENGDYSLIPDSAGIWTDGDLEFDSDTEGFPVDCFGERLSGDFV